ncbi:hybrid sensor histidine kinase/response regulator [Catenovulum agarivorans]|uniref:ATP-binding response regulator n=1 Tax=Catenovulum agarivorans TaxID=1172192 RepID=UPI00047503CF|nr:hybrid sensor histidine kinase/response regulator [Catenovulum agarivorans]
MKLTKDTKILIIDDFDSMRRVTCSQLRSLGAMKIVQAKDGSEAMSLLLEQSFDLILSDWNMPVMSGLELLKAVRANKTLCHIPFIMLTGEAGRERVIEVIACGVSELIVKPYSTNCLAQKIDKVSRWKPRKPPKKEPEKTTHEPVEAIVPPTEATKVISYKPTILVVDDNSDNVALLHQLFKDEFRVLITLNGKRALEICTSDNPPDLVLLDIMMPDMDGFEVATKMREHPNGENIPIIFVTAMEGVEAHSRGLALGAVDFVTKPIEPNLLVPRVRNFLRYVRLHKQLQDDYDTLQENAQLQEQVEFTSRHDLKGSLAAVIGLIQSLSEGSSLKSKQLEQLHMAEEAALQTLNMVNLSTELYKIEKGNYQLNAQPVEIGEILRRIVTLTRNTFATKKLTILIDTDVTGDEHAPQILGDEMFCYSLFQNLIKNACEAAPEQSKVEVALHNESPLCVTIRNFGVVPAEIRANFFDKFVTHGKEDGTGLGTYSAKLLTEAQEGQIALDVSDEDNKTTISVRLPRV